MHEAARDARLGASAYLISGDLLHPRAARLVEPGEQPPRQSRGMIGMAIAVVTTLASRNRLSAGNSRRDRDRRRHRPGHRPADPDDRDAAAGRGIPLAGRHGGSAGRRRGLPRILVGVRASSTSPARILRRQPDRDGPRRRDRRDHLLRLGDRLPQAQRQHEREADPAAGAALDQPGTLRWRSSSSSIGFWHSQIADGFLDRDGAAVRRSASC